MDRRLLWPALTLALVALAALAGWLGLGREGAVRYTGVARVELPLPPAAARPADHMLPRSAADGALSKSAVDGAAAQSTADGALPRSAVDIAAARLDLSLIEDGPFGPLPRIGPDGRRPLFEYARPFNFEDARPKVAVLLLGLGLEAELFDAALALPGPVSLQLSPYAPDLPVLVERARRAGHEVLLDLPMGPADRPASDRRPHTLLGDNSPDENLKHLNWLLARAPGYVAVAGTAARFAGSDQVDDLLDVLARRGLALVEIGASQLADAAAAAGLPYASAVRGASQGYSAPATDDALAELEAEALAAGSVLGVVPGDPVSLDRLRLWAATLDDKGLVLAPVSAVLFEQAGLVRGAKEWPAGRRPA